MIASDVMTRNVISVPPDATVAQAVELMLERGISGLFVVDASGTLAGDRHRGRPAAPRRTGDRAAAVRGGCA